MHCERLFRAMKKLLYSPFLLLAIFASAQIPTPSPSPQTPEPQKTAPLPEPQKTAPTPQPQQTVPLPDNPNPQSTPKPTTAPNDYSQEAYIVKDFQYLARFEKDGTGTKTFNAVIQVQSDAGVQQWGQLVFGYSSANEKLDVNYVRVKKSDGRVITANPDSVQDLTAAVARYAPMYTDYREKHITVPALRPGDTLEYSIVTTTTTALAPNQFWLSYDFDRNIIVLNELLEVNVPKEKQIKLKTDEGYEPKVTTEGDRKIYRWQTKNLVRKSEDELKKEWKKKRTKGDDDQPSVQLTTFQSWEELGKWYAPLQRDRIVATPELKAKAIELTKDKKTELDKIKALYDYVAPEFRYVSLSFGVGRFQPHSAGDIFANKYGDCKDKHTLLSTMLAAIGIHADPVLINSSRQLDPDVPSPAQFDHVITLVTLSDKSKIWLDTTTEVAPFQLLSYQIRKKKALWVPTDNGNAQVIETPATSPVPNEQNLDIAGKINDVGTLTAQIHFTFRGDSELLFRSAFRNSPETEWKNLCGNLGLKGEATDIHVSNPADTNKPFELTYSLSMPNYMAWSTKTPSFGVPLPQPSIPDIDEDEDDQPNEVTLTGAPITSDFKVKLEVPDKYTIGLPLPASVKRDYGYYSVAYGKDKNIITAERKLVLNVRDIPKTRLGDFSAFHRIVNSDQAQLIALETKSNSGPTLPEGLKADDLIAAGGAALQNQNYSAAVESFKRATELEPKNKAAWRGLGAAYLQLQKKTPAIDSFNKLLEINPYDEYAYLGIGYAHIIDHDYDKAVDSFRKQVEINPLDANAQTSLASALVQLRRWDEALPELQKCAQLMPRSPDVQSSLGQVYLELKQSDKALEAFNKAVELGANATIWNNVAYELANHNLQLDRAQQYAESAVTEIATQLRNVDVDRLQIDDYRRVNAISSYWDTLGWVHFRRGDIAQARKFIESAWLLGPNGEVAYHLGEIYEKEGHRDQAIQMYAAAAGVKRSYQPARTKLDEMVKDKKKIDDQMKAAAAKFDVDPKVDLGAASKNDGTADFAFVFAPGPRVEGVKFLSGDDKLKTLNDKLATLKFPVEFPDTTPTKIVRRGTVTCKSDACTLTLQASDEVISAE
jgi:tetratricopeptide (TPR) repeat protein/transglutaminase-like putative cysteine protease